MRTATAQIWDVRSRRRLVVLRDPGGNIFEGAAFDPTGMEIVTAGSDGAARIWSVRTGRQLESIAEPNGGRLTSAAFSPRGAEIVTSGTDGIARIWSVQTRRQLESFAEPNGSPFEQRGVQSRMAPRSSPPAPTELPASGAPSTGSNSPC